MYFVGSNYGWYFASDTGVMYAISIYTGPRYNGARLYMSSDVSRLVDHENNPLWLYSWIISWIMNYSPLGTF